MNLLQFLCNFSESANSLFKSANSLFKSANPFCVWVVPPIEVDFKRPFLWFKNRTSRWWYSRFKSKLIEGKFMNWFCNRFEKMGHSESRFTITSMWKVNMQKTQSVLLLYEFIISISNMTCQCVLNFIWVNPV